MVVVCGRCAFLASRKTDLALCYGPCVGLWCGLEVLFFLMVKMNWCVVTHHKCQRVCLRADVMRGAAVRK